MVLYHLDHLKRQRRIYEQVLGPLETLLPGLLGRGVGPVGGLAPRPMGPRAGLRSVTWSCRQY